MKALGSVLVAGILAVSVAVACGPDGKCVGKDKAACCMSKSSAKKSACTHKAKEAKLEEASLKGTTTTTEPAKSVESPTAAQPASNPKR